MNRNSKRFSAGFSSAANVAAGAAYAEMMAGAGRPLSLRALTVTSNGVAGAVSLVRSWAVGTGTTVQTGVCHQPVATGTPSGTPPLNYVSPSGSARIFSAWSQAPTGIIHALRREVLSTGTGSFGELWKEDYGPLSVEPNQSLIVINNASGIDGPGLHLNFTWDEVV